MPLLRAVTMPVLITSRFTNHGFDYESVRTFIGRMNPNPDRHQQPADDQGRGDGLTQKRHGNDGADERLGREIGGRSRRP